MRQCLSYAATSADFYTGCRKILVNRTFSITDFSDDLTIGDAGFTNMKLSILKRLYYDDDHTKAVAALWKRRLDQDKYGSVGLSTYHHITKADPTKGSKRASVMGPCLLGVTFTLLKHGEVTVDAFYRTTELFKKFPADLVFLRDVVMPHFPMASLKRVNFHFANVTCHPMYFVTVIPSIVASHADGSKHNLFIELDKLKAIDRRFFDWTVKWTARYVCDEYMRGIAKFAQAMRVRQDALGRIGPKTLAALQDYLRTNHPGYRNDYTAPDEDEDDEE